MQRLSNICKPSTHLFTSQIILLNNSLEEKGGNITFIHRYLLKLTINTGKYYIKANLLDNEFFVFSRKDSILFFASFYELRNWIHEIILSGGEIGE